MTPREKWDALPAHVQDKLLEEYRDRCEWKWYEFEYEEFRDRLETIGIHVSDICFSGFWSQGDGASFDGYISDAEKFFAALGKPEIAKAWEEHNLDLSWQVRGHYCHSGSMSFDDSNIWYDNPYNDETEALRHAAWEACNPLGGKVRGAMDDITSFIRGKADELYENLENEYESLTSDEVTLEAILVNHEDVLDENLAELIQETC